MHAIVATLPQESRDNMRKLLLKHAGAQTHLLPLLHDIQALLGYIPPEILPDIASTLNISRAEVHGVVSYYHHFRSTPGAGCQIRLCRAEACQSMGAEKLLAHARDYLGCKNSDISADGLFTLEPVYCLGLCASSPALMIDEEVHARVTTEGFELLVDTIRSELAKRNTEVKPRDEGKVASEARHRGEQK